VALGGNKLRDDVRQSIHGCHMEHWEGVLTVLHAPIRKNVGYEVDASVP
jgi:hypothetical protein